MSAEYRPASRTYWLVDLENTHSRWTLAAKEFREGDVVVLFWSPSVTKVPLEDVSHFSHVSYKFVKCFNGSPNAMDFQLTAWLGRMSALDPSSRFVILSGDHGYEPIIKFMAESRIFVALLDPSSLEAVLIEDGRLIADSSVIPEEYTMAVAPDGPSHQKPVQPEPADNAGIWNLYRDKLMEFGVTDQQDLSFMSDVLYISMQSPQNKRKLGVRNRMMAHYGTQDGNLRYNALKALIHEIANNGPHPKPGSSITPSSLDTHTMNVALSQAGITLKTGQAAKAVQAVADAAMAKNPNDVIYKAVGDIFDKADHQKANRVLRTFLNMKMKRGT